MQKINQKTLTTVFAIILISLVTFFITYEILSSKENEKKLSQQQLIQEAKAHFQGMVDTRTWNAQYGGVYVKASSGLKPNKYLKNNTLLTDKNETLVKINPAWMTRQISEISNKQGTYHFRITSLKPLNPSNKSDSFETKALEYFEENRNEKYFYSFNESAKSFDFMGALVTTKSCLKCHEVQGYKVGDIRGGIRVSIPLEIYTQQVTLISQQANKSVIIVLLVALVLMGIVYWFISMLYKRQHEIEHAKEILEEKVLVRTQDLQEVLSHEKNLKDVLKIIAEVNEMLITSYSTTTVLKNAIESLAESKAYSLVLGGLVHGDIVEIIAQSVQNRRILPHNIISLNERKSTDYLFDVIDKAVKLKHTIIEKVVQESESEQLRREGDVSHEWMITLPLIDNIKEDVYGIITVFSSREDGFDIEEIKILETMAHDISLALYSHKQKESLLLMEQEKTANYEETILAFVNIIEQRDTYTAGHTIRVAEYCALIAKEMGYKKDEIHKLEKAAILHDIGKVATPDSILLKPGKLSHLEYELIKQHSEVGADMLERISIYKDLANIIRYHHSRYDGKGYPRTSSPAEIPMLSHIMIVADAFDAMTTNRIYKPRKTVREALSDVQNASGTQFHPDVVKATCIALEKVKISETSQLPTTELEKKRMAYFFHDALTGLYNEDYLPIALNSPSKSYTCLYLVNLKKFTIYNKHHGWKEGNKRLQEFAKFLEELFPKSLILRYHGDDFIVLSTRHLNVNKEDIVKFSALKDNSLGVSIRHYDLVNAINIEKFRELEKNYNEK